MPIKVFARPEYDLPLFADDMAAKGWVKSELAEHAEVSDMTVIRLLRGEPVRPSYAKKVAAALGYSLRRYLIRQAKAS